LGDKEAIAQNLNGDESKKKEKPTAPPLDIQLPAVMSGEFHNSY